MKNRFFAAWWYSTTGTGSAYEKPSMGVSSFASAGVTLASTAIESAAKSVEATAAAIVVPMEDWGA